MTLVDPQEIHAKIIHLAPKKGDILFVEVAPEVPMEEIEELQKYLQMNREQYECLIFFIPQGFNMALRPIEELVQIRDSIDTYLKRMN